jgi:outer membrane lipoprotein SlyB
MRKITLAAASAATLLGGCMTAADRGGYYADQYYRDGPTYSERVLTERDTIYVGRDGRYYCRRDDGTTGLIVGGIAGGVLGGVIAPGGSKTLGAILGAGAGALAGREIDRSNVRCR